MIGQSGKSEFGSLYDVLALVDDKARYEAKIKELDGRVNSAKAIHEQAAAQNRQAAEHRGFAANALDQAAAKLKEAREVEAANNKAAVQLAEERAAHDQAVRDHHARIAHDQEQLHAAANQQANRVAADDAERRKRADELVQLEARTKERQHTLDLRIAAVEEAERFVAARKADLDGVFSELKRVLGA